MSQKKQPTEPPPPTLSFTVPSLPPIVASKTPSIPKSKMPTGPSPYALILDTINKKVKKPAPTKTIGHRIKKNTPKTRTRISNLDTPHYRPFSKFILYTYKNTNGTYKYLENGPTGLVFENVDTKEQILFPNEKAAHLHMKQEAWMGGKSKKTRRKNKTYKK